MKTPVSKFRIAIYGVIIENGKVLMTETKGPSGVIVNFPGGGLELGEAPQLALLRELEEETQFKVAVKELLYCTQKFHQNNDFPQEQLMHIYYCAERLDSREVLPVGGNNDDVLSVKWASLSEIRNFHTQPVDQEFINEILAVRLLKD